MNINWDTFKDCFLIVLGFCSGLVILNNIYEKKVEKAYYKFEEQYKEKLEEILKIKR